MFSPTNQLWRDARLAAQSHTTTGERLSINFARCGHCRAVSSGGVKHLRVYREPGRVLLYYLCARCARAGSR